MSAPSPAPVTVTPPPGPASFVLLPATRPLLWVALAATLAVAGWQALLHRFWALLPCLLLVLLAVWLRARQRQVLVDDHGYRVLVGGKLRFSVAWTELTRALHAPTDRALYLDCGDARRNFFLPPPTGYGFTFSDRDTLYALLLAHLPADCTELPSLSALVAPAPAPADAPPPR